MKILRETKGTRLSTEATRFNVYVKKGGGFDLVLTTHSAETASKAFDFYERNPNDKFPI